MGKMRLSRAPTTLLSLLAIILSSAHPSLATPFPKDESSEILQNSTLELRCAYPCGWSGQLCCPAAEACYTDSSGQAQCGSGQISTGFAVAQQTAVVSGQWQYWTSTYVQTDLVTITSVFSSFVAASSVAPVITPAATSATCYSGSTQCGNTCCTSEQYCGANGICMAVGGSSAYYSSFASVMASSSASAFVRPTSASIVTVTSTGSPTTTVPFQTAVTTGATISGTQVSSNNGLSGGAIAGIVIGVIAGIILLILFCICCCFKGAIDGLRDLFGIRRRNRTVVEERYESRHHSGGAGGGRTWFGGGGPSRIDRPPPKKSSGGGLGGFTGVAAALTTLAIILGLKRRRDRRNEKSSYGSGSSYSYSEYTSESSESSDRRTRDTRRSRR